MAAEIAYRFSGSLLDGPRPSGSDSIGRFHPTRCLPAAIIVRGEAEGTGDTDTIIIRGGAEDAEVLRNCYSRRAASSRKVRTRPITRLWIRAFSASFVAAHLMHHVVDIGQ